MDKIALAASHETRWAAVLLGTGGETASGVGGGGERGELSEAGTSGESGEPNEPADAAGGNR